MIGVLTRCRHCRSICMSGREDLNGSWVRSELDERHGLRRECQEKKREHQTTAAHQTPIHGLPEQHMANTPRRSDFSGV